jgi:hypothetical protein
MTKRLQLSAAARRFRPNAERLEDRLALSADAVLDWNLVLLNANAVDHSVAAPEQGGPTRTARAFAIVHAAMYDAVNSIARSHAPYLVSFSGYQNASARAAVSQAAHDTLVALYPSQKPTFDAALVRSLAEIPNGTAENRGVELGVRVAVATLAARNGDGSELPQTYTFQDGPGVHNPDPHHPNQGALTAKWGKVDPFVINAVEDFRSPPPPALGSLAYTAAYYEVALLGGDGTTTPTMRTREQTEIGIFWGYDGTPGLGTPPRLYNQITRVIAQNKHNTLAENARLFALVNLAQADAGIQCWDSKYVYNLWRPIVGIREGGADTNPLTIGMANWSPLGAPCTNCVGPGVLNFTPPFPAYPSGHATFGAATFRTIANFYGTDRISFDFTSDEFNGVNRDANGNVRPVRTRHYDRLSQAAEENGQSRIYLGIHWAFDKTQGIAAGNRIADYVVRNALQLVGSSSLATTAVLATASPQSAAGSQVVLVSSTSAVVDRQASTAILPTASGQVSTFFAAVRPTGYTGTQANALWNKLVEEVTDRLDG